ncbi:MAG: DUF4157 domain-containing protein [Bacteroidetes bacterium]|nr:DUF4157 domain-containing protein [Bacteroidota bacterium]
MGNASTRVAAENAAADPQPARQQQRRQQPASRQASSAGSGRVPSAGTGQQWRNTGIPTHASISPGRRACVQPKLSINAPDDRFEREADSIADHVMNGTSAAGENPAGKGGPGIRATADTTRAAVSLPVTRIGDGAVQTKCAKCEEDENKKVQRKATDSTATGTAGAAGDGISGSLNGSGGSPIPPPVRSFFENRMGTDFSGVRVHDDSDAARMNGQLSARAFTHGAHIYFNRGEYNPTSRQGRTLLAHELVHTMQQQAAGPMLQRKGKDGDPDGKNPKMKTGGSKEEKLVPYDIPVDVTDVKHPDKFLNHTVRKIFGSDPTEAEAIIVYFGLHWDDASWAGPTQAGTTQTVLFPKSVLDVYQKQIDDLRKKPGGLIDAAKEKQKKQREQNGTQHDGTNAKKGLLDNVFDLPVPFTPGLGVVQVEKGTMLWETPERKNGALLPFNQHVVVVKPTDNLLFVQVPGADDNRFGYVERADIDMNVPDPGSMLHKIPSGETADKLVENTYGVVESGAGTDKPGEGGFTWGKDKRLYVNALLYINRKAGRSDGIRGDSYQTARTYADKIIWLPSKQYVLFLRDTGEILTGSLSYDLTQAFLNSTLGPAILQVGIVHGALESLWGLVEGLYELVKLAIELFIALIKGNLWATVSAFWKKLEGLDISALATAGIEDVVKKWNDPDLFKKWEYRGWLIGYVAMEVILTFFTEGLFQAVKGFARSAELMKFIEKIPGALEVLESVKGLSKEGKGAELLEKLKQSEKIGPILEKFDQARKWAKSTLELPMELLERMDLEALDRLKSLGEKYWQKLKNMFRRDPEKTIDILGCHSPCDVDVEHIKQELDAVGEVLDVVDPRKDKLLKDYKGDAGIVDDAMKEAGGDPGRAKKILVEKHGLDDVTADIMRKRGFGDYDPALNRAVRGNGDIASLTSDGEWMIKRADGNVIREYTVGTHGELTKPDMGTNSFFQSHHVMQDKRLQDLFREIPSSVLEDSKLRYAREDAPAVLLRDSIGGSPHRIITNLQAGRAGETFTVEKGFQTMLADLNEAGVPTKVQEQLIDHAQKYFGDLYHNITDEAWRTKIFGSWKPPL